MQLNCLQDKVREDSFPTKELTKNLTKIELEFTTLIKDNSVIRDISYSISDDVATSTYQEEQRSYI